ncbi:MAG: Abi family protein [Sulfobacillus sp.]
MAARGHPDTVVNSFMNFDRRWRGLMLGMLEGIEIRLRTQWSYYLGHTYGGLVTSQ